MKCLRIRLACVYMEEVHPMAARLIRRLRGRLGGFYCVWDGRRGNHRAEQLAMGGIRSDLWKVRDNYTFYEYLGVLRAMFRDGSEELLRSCSTVRTIQAWAEDSLRVFTWEAYFFLRT